jgi:hypothetical protein
MNRRFPLDFVTFGTLLSCLIIGLLLEINDKRQKGAEETWLEKYGDEIG